MSAGLPGYPLRRVRRLLERTRRTSPTWSGRGSCPSWSPGVPTQWTPPRSTALASEFSGDVVMSDSAWADYRVTGYPFLVLIDPPGRRILAETVGFDWADVAEPSRLGSGTS